MLKRIAFICALLGLAATMLAACGGDDAEESTTASGSACEEVDAPPPKEGVKLKAPSADAPTATGVEFDTSCGSFTVSFDDRAPKTAASFQHLAEEASSTTPSFTASSPTS